MPVWYVEKSARKDFDEGDWSDRQVVGGPHRAAARQRLSRVCSEACVVCRYKGCFEKSPKIPALSDARSFRLSLGQKKGCGAVVQGVTTRDEGR